MHTRLYAVVVVAVGVGVAAGYFGPGLLDRLPSRTAPAPTVATAAPEVRRPAVAVEATIARRLPLARELAAVGSLRSDESVMVRPEVAGRIREIGFSDGVQVKRGQILFQLDDATTSAEARQARANLALAQSKYKRAEELQRQGFISSQARDEADNAFKVEQANVALAQARLAKTVIRAPFDGKIGLRNVSVGDYVREGQDLVTLEAINQLKVDFRIPEMHLTGVSTGQALQVTLDALPGRHWQGKVAAISPLVDAAGRAIVMRAQVDNEDGALRPGLFARVRLRLADGEAVMVPETALVPRDNRQYVFIVRDGTVEQVEVSIGQRQSGRVEITNGVEAGDQVVTAGLQKVQDGTRVAVTLVDTPG